MRALKHFDGATGPKIFVNAQHEPYTVAATPIHDLREIDWTKSAAYNWFIEDDEEICSLIEYLLYIQRSDRPFPTTTVCIDEADRYQMLGDQERWKRCMVEISGKGQRFGLSAWWLTQRPRALDPQIYSQCNDFYFFYLTGPDQLHLIERKGLDVRPYATHIEQAYHYVWTDERTWQAFGADGRPTVDKSSDDEPDDGADGESTQSAESGGEDPAALAARGTGGAGGVPADAVHTAAEQPVGAQEQHRQERSATRRELPGSRHIRGLKAAKRNEV